jgi:hypothetical membrane protein
MERRRLAAAAGLFGAAVALGGILLATTRSPTFAWADSALSDLGARSGTAALFNGGLLAGAALGLPFVGSLWARAANALQRAGAAGVGVALAALGGVGLFPAGTPAHVPVAVTFFLAFTAAVLLHGVGSLRAGARRRGLATAILAVGHVAVWVGWGILGPAVGVSGVAVPEFLGALAFGGWIAWTAVDTARDD